MRFPPPEVIASWPKPNYSDSVTRGNDLSIINIVFGILCTLAVFIRLHVRLVMSRTAGADDILIVLSLAGTIAMSVLTPYAVSNYGWNRHIWDVRPEDFGASRKLTWVTQILFIITMGLTRISILLFYKRMTTRTSGPAFMRITNTCLAFNVLYMVTFIVLLLAGCRPLHAFWDAYNPDYMELYNCVDEEASLMASAVMSSVLDIAVVGIPCYHFVGLQVTCKKLISLLAVFATGLLVVVAGATRSIYLANTVDTYDITWVGYDIWVWAAIENGIALLCACIPALKQAYKKVVGDMTKLIQSITRQTTEGSSSGPSLPLPVTMPQTPTGRTRPRGIGRTRTMIIADDMTDQEDPTDLGTDILVTTSFGVGEHGLAELYELDELAGNGRPSFAESVSNNASPERGE